MADIIAAFWRRPPDVPYLYRAGGPVNQTLVWGGGPCFVVNYSGSSVYTHQITLVEPYETILFAFDVNGDGSEEIHIGDFPAGTILRFQLESSYTSPPSPISGFTKFNDGPDCRTRHYGPDDGEFAGQFVLSFDDQAIGGGDRDFNDHFLWIHGAIPQTAGVRRWNGSTWTDITYDLNTATGVTEPVIWDLKYVNGELLGIVRSTNTNQSALVSFAGDHWALRQRIDNDNLGSNPLLWQGSYSAFVCIAGQTYVHGEANFVDANNRSHYGWGLWKLQGGLPRPFTYDEHNMRFSVSRRTGLLYLPQEHRLLCADLGTDEWGYLDMFTGQFTMSSDYGGSCVFSIGADNDGVIWSGDYGMLYYRSLDRGVTYHPHESEVHRLPEVWEFLRWDNQLWAVGCNPCAVIHRNSNDGRTASLHDSWDVAAVLDPTLDPRTDGAGFQSAEPVNTDTLIIGFGGEPYYYNRVVGSSTVYKLHDGVLIDIGDGLDWGHGVHLVTSAATFCSQSNLGGSGGPTDVHFDPVNEPGGNRLHAS